MTTTQHDDYMDIIANSGMVSTEVLIEAHKQSQVSGQNILQVLISGGHITKTDAQKIGARANGMDFIELAETQLDTSAVWLLTREQALDLKVIPVRLDAERLVVASSFSQASNIVLKEDLERLTGHKVGFVIARQSDIDNKIANVYRAEQELRSLADEARPEDAEIINLEVTEDSPLIKFANLVIQQAITDRASDIHIEPTENEVRIRYRVDGVLKEQQPAPKHMQSGLISRFKIMSDIDIATTMRPQDGRMTIMHQGQRMDLRVAALPIMAGREQSEKIVMRILNNSTAQMSLDDLGFSDHNSQVFAKSYRKPYGMILVTGPTGSGKSTTLYATLNVINKPEVNTITVEDPVEYQITGVNQCQVNAKAGMTFAAALRSILRADPDIVLIGEIRDHETAQIAIEAALTGHLVLSTLHTNDAPSAITRLVEMGIEPFLVGSSIEAVLAQRLCRQLCQRCKEPVDLTDEELAKVPDFPIGNPGQVFKAVGCSHCNHIGYRGRTGLHEVMAVNDDIERLAVAQATSEEIAAAARANGMMNLRQDGWAKVLQGITSIEEVLRVVA